MFDWIIFAVGGGLIAAGCATGSILTRLLQRLLRAPKKETAVKEAISAQDVEANRENQGDGMEDLLFDEKLKLLVMKENLKKKLLKQKQIIRQLMGNDRGQQQQQPTPSAGAAAVAAVLATVGGAGDKIGTATSDATAPAAAGGSSEDARTGGKDRLAMREAEAEYFASELELSKWAN